jgi:hypothetical protein
LGFFLVILLPVLLFTIYQIYKLVAVLLHNHKVDMINAVNETASDEVKEAIIAEYLAKQKNEEAEKNNTEEIAETLLAGNTVIVDVSLMPRSESMRMLDFLSGVMFALEGDMKRINKTTFEYSINKKNNSK